MHRPKDTVAYDHALPLPLLSLSLSLSLPLPRALSGVVRVYVCVVCVRNAHLEM
jgi:hypothetical protein